MDESIQQRIRLLELEAEALDLDSQPINGGIPPLTSGPVSLNPVELGTPLNQRADLPYDAFATEHQNALAFADAQEQTHELMKEGYNQAAGNSTRLLLETGGALLAPQMQVTKAMPFVNRLGGYGVNALSQALGFQAGNEAAQQFDLATSKTISEDLHDVGVNTAIGAAIPLGLEGLKSAGNALSGIGDRFAESSIGARVRDFVNSKKRTGAWEGANGELETRLSSAIKEETAAGTFPALRRPAAVEASVTSTKEGFGQQIGSIIGELDQVGSSPQLAFSRTEKIINEAPFNLREGLRGERDAFLATLGEWNGTASELHRARSSIGQTAFRPTPNAPAQKISRKMQQALYGDLTDSLDGAMRQAIASGQIPADRAMQLAEANRRYGNLKEVEEIVTDAALSAQHAQMGPMQRALWPTTGYGVPMAGAYAKWGLPGALSVYTIGTLSRTRAGQAFLGAVSRGGGAAMQLMGEAASNPYMVRGLSLAALPRDWEVVKDDPAARETIALKMGIPPEQFNSLPEPAQMEIHKELVSIDPNNAEPTPQNLNIVNGQYVDPMEKDAMIRQALEMSPSERAKIISGAFQNKFVPTGQPTPQASPVVVPPSVDLSQATRALSLPDYSYDQSATSTLDELEASRMRHFEGDYMQ